MRADDGPAEFGVRVWERVVAPGVVVPPVNAPSPAEAAGEERANCPGVRASTGVLTCDQVQTKRGVLAHVSYLDASTSKSYGKILLVYPFLNLRHRSRAGCLHAIPTIFGKGEV